MTYDCHDEIRYIEKNWYEIAKFPLTNIKTFQ